MADTLKHINKIGNDTIHKDSVATNSYYAPKHKKGFKDSVSNNYKVKQIDTLPVIQPAKGLEAEQYFGSQQVSSGIMLLTIISFCLIVVSLKNGFRYYQQLIRDSYLIRLRENAFEDRTINETFILSSLIGNSCIMQGVWIYYTLRYFNVAVVSLDFFLFPVIICIVASALLYLFKLGLYRLLGYTFGTPDQTRIWLDGYNACQSLSGILFIPIVIMLNIYSGTVTNLSIYGIIIYSLSIILFVCKGFRIFFNKIERSLFFILYLCAVEIIPAVITVAFIVYICNSLFIKTLIQ